MHIELSEMATHELVKLLALESGQVGNFSRIEPAIDRIRYRIFDIVMTEMIQQIVKIQKS